MGRMSKCLSVEGEGWVEARVELVDESFEVSCVEVCEAIKLVLSAFAVAACM